MRAKAGKVYRLKQGLNEKFNVKAGESVKIGYIGHTMTEFQSVDTGYFGIVKHEEVENYFEEVV